MTHLPQSPQDADLRPPPPELLLAAIVDSSDDAIISKSLNGIITSWNKSAERLFGYTQQEALGRPVHILIPPDRHDEEVGILDRVQRGEKVDHFETVRQRKDGRLLDVSVTISPIRAGDGTIIGASKIVRDVSHQKRQSDASLLLASIVSSSDDAIVSKNLNGIITSWNRGAERIFGYSAEEAVGRSVLMLVPEDRKGEEPEILARLRRGERVDHFETIRVKKNGEHFPVSLTISPVRNADGVIIGASKIARDITELKRVNSQRDELLESERVARGEAERANQMKDDFIATVSHELRTPLNAIMGWIQVLRESLDRPAELIQGVDIIERNALSQAQLIDDLLDLGRISSGKLTLDVQTLDITSVVRDAITTLRPAAELKSLRLKTILNNSGGVMMGDRHRLQQVIWNVVSNAIKFTPKNGSVEVMLSRVNSHMEIRVTDNGRGIASEFLPHVFERFRQADSSTTRQFGGLGIGLALVKQLVELHGGEVKAESLGLGQGATFTIVLPIVAARSETPATGPSHGTVTAKPFETEDLSGIKVLVVDDDKDSLDVIKRILSSRKADVRTATSVEEAMTNLETFEPNVILSDIGMPGQDGYELIQRVRARKGSAFTPAAALTALARAEDRMRALQAGFQTHVAKPIAPRELVAVVRSLGAWQPSRGSNPAPH